MKKVMISLVLALGLVFTAQASEEDAAIENRKVLVESFHEACMMNNLPKADCDCVTQYVAVISDEAVFLTLLAAHLGLDPFTQVPEFAAAAEEGVSVCLAEETDV